MSCTMISKNSSRPEYFVTVLAGEAQALEVDLHVLLHVTSVPRIFATSKTPVPPTGLDTFHHLLYLLVKLLDTLKLVGLK